MEYSSTLMRYEYLSHKQAAKCSTHMRVPFYTIIHILHVFSAT